jgi:hypothetical protein
MNIKKIYYLGYWIFEIAGQYVVSLDNTTHKTLVSAKCHIDWLLN